MNNNEKLAEEFCNWIYKLTEKDYDSMWRYEKKYIVCCNTECPNWKALVPYYTKNENNKKKLLELEREILNELGF